METGNPKQVAILSVMAVGAFGFLATRLGGKSPAVALTAAAQAEGRKASTVLSDSPILIDPFSHPKLAPAKPTTPADDSNVKTASMNSLTGDIEGTLPLATAPLTAKVVSAEGEKQTKKVESPTKPEQPPVEPVEVALEATAGASEDVAFLSINGADSQPFHPNDSIKGKVRLLRIEDGSIIVSGPKGELTINVGEHKRI
jgi:hypothetical protein